MIRIGIVGCGRILNAHLQGYKRLRELGVENFRITALVARREDDARMFLRRGEGPPPRPPVLPPESGDPLAAPHTYLSDFQDDVEVQVYTDYREMLKRAPVDAVNDFTTLAMHHQVGLAALSAGKHLLTEKPLAISVRAAQRMVELAQQRGLTFGVFENVRQLRIVRAMHWAVQRGLIGRPQMAIIGSLGGLWSPDRVVADTPWRHRKLEAGGGGAVDIGVHHFHWLRYVFGEVTWVSAVTRTFEPVRYRRDEAGRVVETVAADVDDTYLAVAGFEDGAIAQMLWSWAGHGEPLEIPGTPAFYGSEGCIKGGELIYGDGRRESLMERFEREMSTEERERFFPLGLTDPFAIQQLDWLRAIEQGHDPETSGREGLRDVACAFALLESATLGRRVTVEEVLSGAVAAYQADLNAHYRL
jgi:1,5-anhydro-D-fructose reductase (1,5-anhydro-D-mannitol-forming)